MDIKNMTAILVAVATIGGLATTGWVKMVDLEKNLERLAGAEQRVIVLETKVEDTLESLIAQINTKIDSLTERTIDNARALGEVKGELKQYVEDKIKEYNEDTKNPLAI